MGSTPVSQQARYEIRERLDCALKARVEMLDISGEAAMRLFNGYYEGCPELLVDLYGRTLLLYGYGAPQSARPVLDYAQAELLRRLDWVDCVIQKVRNETEISQRRGTLNYGEQPAQRVKEHGVWYAVELMMNQDASFYLDTRLLRRWLLENSAGWRVLNTFAYTGSLGVAALAGGAETVVQVDRNHQFLAMARRSGMLNRLDIGKMKLRRGDFFSQVAAFKRQGVLFDCVIVDPPFFSITQKGTIDLARESVRTINKVRPLVKDGGWLAMVTVVRSVPASPKVSVTVRVKVSTSSMRGAVKVGEVAVGSLRVTVVPPVCAQR